MNIIEVKRTDSLFYHHIRVVEQEWSALIDASIETLVAEGVFLFKSSADSWLKDTVFEYMVHEGIVKEV